MKIRQTHFIPILSILLLGASWAAQAAPVSETGLAKAHTFNQSEMKGGTLAQDKACGPSVRQFGKELYVDHKAADQKLTDIGQQQGFDLQKPAFSAWELQNLQKQEAAMDALQSKSDCTFDHDFLMAMVDGHQFAITVITQSRDASQSQVARDYFNSLLPTMQLHLETAQRLLGQN